MLASDGGATHAPTIEVGTQSAPPPAVDHPAGTTLRGAAVVGAILALLPADEGLRGQVRGAGSAWQHDTARFFETLGGPVTYLSVSGGSVAIGVLAPNKRWRDGGMRVAATLAATSIVVRGLKHAAGRARPQAERGSNHFDPFSSHTSMPSGHTAMAFAMASSIAYEIDRRWVTVTLYTVAAGAGWSRLHDDRHWASDVLAGAAIGYGSSYLVRNLRTGANVPTIALRVTGLAVTWRYRF